MRRVESIESEKTSIENEENVCGVCGGDNSTCTDCEGNIKPGFVIYGSCDKFIDQLDGSRSVRWLFQQKKLSKVLDKLQVVIFRKFSYFMVLNLSIKIYRVLSSMDELECLFKNWRERNQSKKSHLLQRRTMPSFG